MPFKIIDHTADIRIRVTERNRKFLYLRLANAMINLIFESPDIRCEFQRRVEVRDVDAVAFLNHILYEIEKGGIIFKVTCIAFIDNKVVLGICGEKIDTDRHEYHYLIKAATYDRFMETENTVEVTFDI